MRLVDPSRCGVFEMARRIAESAPPTDHPGPPPEYADEKHADWLRRQNDPDKPSVVVPLSAGEAQRLTERIKVVAGSVRDSMFKLCNLVGEAKASNAWSVLGYPSWPAYLADTLGSEPMRLGRADRRELVDYLSGEGMSTRAIASIAGVDQKTVVNDRRAGAENSSPVTESETPVEPREVVGLDGKTYTKPPSKPQRRRALTDQAHDAGWELRKAAERLARIREDDRFSRNKEEITAHLRGHLIYAIETCQGFLDDIETGAGDGKE